MGEKVHFVALYVALSIVFLRKVLELTINASDIPFLFPNQFSALLFQRNVHYSKRKCKFSMKFRVVYEKNNSYTKSKCYKAILFHVRLCSCSKYLNEGKPIS